MSKSIRPSCPANETGRWVSGSRVVVDDAESSYILTGNPKSVNGVLVTLPGT